ncbi:MAG: hypothetical protein GX652_04895 [Burkholderiaceae bacterium]|nr:hypothetical protein [Burkholderiaceae bacterium]
MTFFAGICAAGPAAASSFVALPDAKPGPSPSIVYLGESAPILAAAVQAPPASTVADFAGTAEALAQSTVSLPTVEPIYRISPSIVAYGTPAIEDVKVASIGDEPEPARFAEMPMVIRGGIVGDAFTSAEPAVPSPDAEDPHRRMEGSARAPAPRPRPSPEREQPQQAVAPPPSDARPGSLEAPR